MRKKTEKVVDNSKPTTQAKARGAAPKQSSAPNKGKQTTAEDPKPAKRGRGRPKGTPDVWTTERKAEVVEQLEAYVKKTPYPSIADFCYKHLIRKCRLYEFPEFAFWREMLILKKTAVLEDMGRRLNRDHGSRGNFIALALGQVGFTAVPETASDDEALRARKESFDALFGQSGAPI